MAGTHRPRCASRSPRSTPPSATSRATRRRSARAIDARPRRRAPSSCSFPELAHHRLPARGPAAQGALPARRARGALEPSPPTADGHRRDGRLPGARRGRLQRARACSPTARCAPIYRKVHLPNYGVFDEQRYFQAGTGGAVLELGDARIGLTICEDIWEPGPPASDEALAGATLIVNVSASPYHARQGPRARADARPARPRQPRARRLLRPGRRPGRARLRRPLARRRPRGPRPRPRAAVRRGAAGRRRRRAGARCRAPARHAPAPAGARRAARGRATWARSSAPSAPTAGPPAARSRELLEPEARRSTPRSCSARATTSRRTASSTSCSASRAASTRRSWRWSPSTRSGPSGSTCVMMPSPYSSEGTQDDARRAGRNLGVELPRAADRAARWRPTTSCWPSRFAGREPDITEENLQARIRGNLLMALSNKFGWLVLTTGNKSEMSVGYSTLYGDSAGGFAVIKDVPEDARLPARRRTATRATTQHPVPAVDRRRARRAPSCAPTSSDQDSLPPYDDARRDPRGLRRGGPRPRAADRARPARGDVDRVIRARRPRRVQAPPGAAGHQDHAAGVRARPAHADHQPLPRLGTARAPAALRQAPAAVGGELGVGNGVCTCGRGSVAGFVELASKPRYARLRCHSAVECRVTSSER